MLSKIIAVLKDLPGELVHHILGHIATPKEGYALAPCATVSDKWQQVVESLSFTEVTIHLTNASILSGETTPQTLANIISGTRLRSLRKLRLIIDFDPLSFTSVTDSLQRRMKLGSDFVDVVDGFVDTMNSWKREALFDLEIHEEQSCGHHLNHFGSDFVHGPRRSIQCVRSIRLMEYNCDRCRCCSYRGLLSYLCTAMSGSGSLDGITYEYQERVPRNRAIHYERWDFLPLGLKSLTIINNEQSGDEREIVLAHSALNRSLMNISCQLKTLRVSHSLDVVSLFLSCAISTGLNARWHHLQHISMTCAALGLNGEILEMEMTLLAKAVQQMPSIKKIELWSAKTKDQSYFSYTVDGRDARAVWEMSWDFRVSEALADAWSLTARQDTWRDLTIEVRRFVPDDGGEREPLAASAFSGERLYSADDCRKPRFGIPYSNQFEYSYEYEVWG
ncbi:uncharacterized protein CTRU02_205033 [Colletotrichum truncatum]|uniref:Uncharacterized protein n=1 Tax=Colletotrichum truncatum TaxID=5467 RepID=A0ACC3Z2W2_COLTU|nr:uncharacterized protein CTRU02_06137 [Colletotrichum truncatum]KAF6793265.1 hypothetical protein CTRU02_06137 [Colletotrichum truncatum]